MDRSIQTSLQIWTQLSSVGGVKTEVVYYSGGYGYRIEPGTRTDGAKRWSADFLKQYEGDIIWMLAQFGNLNSAQL